MDDYRMEVRLKSRRTLLEWMRHRKVATGYQLAKKAGLKQGVVGHLVKGRRTSCSLHTALAIEEALDVSQGTLFMVREYDAAAYSGLSKELIDKRRREGLIDVRYDGDKVLIVRESLDLYLDSLPSERSA